MAKQGAQELVAVQEIKPGTRLPVTQADVDALIGQRSLFQKFVKDQLAEDVDYGTIPGTPKPSLWKPGSEKLAQLFGIGVRITMVDKMLDIDKNFAYFSYRAETYMLRQPDLVLTQCEGSCNSQEKKYKERSVYEWNDRTKKKEFVRTEATPVCDILNTLQKMAQKRAYVGAIMQATGASDFFNHDIEDETDAEIHGLDPNQRRPTIIKAPMPKATSANSSDMARTSSNGVKTPAQQAPTPQSKDPDPGSFDNFQAGSLFAGKATHPEETVEELQGEIFKLNRSLSFSDAQFHAEVRKVCKKEAQVLDLTDLKKLRDHYRKLELEARRGK